MLTGKSKPNFESYYIERIRTERKDYDKYSDEVVLRKFYRYLLSMQFGVYQDYADSIGYSLEVGYYLQKYQPHIYNLYSECVHDGLKYKTLDEARKAALKAFDEIVNGVCEHCEKSNCGDVWCEIDRFLKHDCKPL